MIKHCRLENEIKINAIFPIIFETKHSKSAKYFMNFVISKHPKNSRLIYYIGVSFNKTELTITSEELQTILDTISDITKISNSNQE